MYEKNAWEVLNGAIKQERRNGNYKDWEGIIIILHLENKNFKVGLRNNEALCYDFSFDRWMIEM